MSTLKEDTNQHESVVVGLFLFCSAKFFTLQFLSAIILITMPELDPPDTEYIQSEAVDSKDETPLIIPSHVGKPYRLPVKPRYDDVQKYPILQEAEKKALDKKAPLQLRQIAAKSIQNDMRFRLNKSPEELVSNNLYKTLQIFNDYYRI